MQNAITWFEIPTANLDRAMKFYAALSGTPLRREAYGAPGEEMAVFTTSDQQGVGGCLVATPHAQPSQQGTVVYLDANPSIDVWLARVDKAGGSVVVPKTVIPGGEMGCFAHIVDTEGNRVGLHAMA